MHYLISGGTGYVGSQFLKTLPDDTEITILSRRFKNNHQNISYVQNLDDIPNNTSFDVIMNLAGEPIDQRWSASVKNKLFQSRLKTTQDIIKLIKRLDRNPGAFISASAVGYYGDLDQEILDESSKPKSSFTHQLCHAWEDIAQQAEKLGVRTCITRFGVILGKNSGFMKRVLLPFQMGVGGKIGSGNQGFPWVHIDDVIHIFHNLISDVSRSGVYNVTAPSRDTNLNFTKTMGDVLNRPTILPMPACIVRTIFGEMGNALLLKGNFITPQRLLDADYTFRYPSLKSALENSTIKNH